MSSVYNVTHVTGSYHPVTHSFAVGRLVGVIAFHDASGIGIPEAE